MTTNTLDLYLFFFVLFLHFMQLIHFLFHTHHYSQHIKIQPPPPKKNNKNILILNKNIYTNILYNNNE